MKISIVVPSEKYLQTAGVRIRYRRLIAPLEPLGCTLDIVPLDRVGDLMADRDQIYVLSKCQDARAVALAITARRAGIVLGVDLFDDYFSQTTDPRFAAQRMWLRSMARHANFFLCSTPRMLEVGNDYFATGAGHLLRDPHDMFDPLRLEQELATKIRKAKRERRIPVLWFGIGNNPNFPVGLHDLAAFAEVLRPLQENNYRADLTILTNRAAVDGQMLERLRRLPLPFVIREWSKTREEEALSRCLVSFLPVNFQQFSIAKSLNRGVSALVGGTQLLTAGYPLYETLNDYIYEDAGNLIDDLEKENLHLSSKNIENFSRWIRDRAAPEAEATKLMEFLTARPAPSTDEVNQDKQFAVLHGVKSAGSINSFAQRLGWLSLGSPLSPGGMMCDAHLGVFGDDHSLRLRVSQAGLEQLPEEFRVAAVWCDKSLGNGPDWDVPLGGTSNERLSNLISVVGKRPCTDASVNAEVMTLTRNFFTTLFPNLHIVDSELDPVSNIIRALGRI